MTRIIACIATGVGLLAASPVLAGGQADTLAACMWQKMPTSTAAFVENVDPQREFSLFMKAMVPCGGGLSGGVHLTKLKKTLVKARPSTIEPDVETANNAFVCPRGDDGKPGTCQAAGE